MTPIMNTQCVVMGLLWLSPAIAASYRFGAIWDGAKVWNNACVTVQGGRIESVGPCAAGAVNLSRYTAIPGLIDVHTHMTYVLESKVSRPARSAAVVFLAQENARKTLDTGVTTVRDLGAQNYADIAMRDLIDLGQMKGPRMFVAGYGLSAPRTGRPTSPNSAKGVEEVAKVARQQIDAGADWVKMYASTGSGQDVSGNQTYTFEEMKAAVDAAHAGGKRIAIHSYGPDGARDAVRAGTDSLEHATDMDDATIAEIARRQIFYVPTIDHNTGVSHSGHAGSLGIEATIGRPSGDEMARRRYQRGHLRLCGKKEKVWVAKWRENVLLADGSVHRVQKGEVLGTVKEYKTRRPAGTCTRTATRRSELANLSTETH